MKDEWPLISRDEYLQRLDSIKDTKQSDCYGTAFYLAGMQPRDETIQKPGLFQLILNTFQSSEYPIPGWFGIWSYTAGNLVYPKHAGLITEIFPKSLATHRSKECGELEVNKPLEELPGLYATLRVDATFFRPERIKGLTF